MFTLRISTRAGLAVLLAATFCVTALAQAPSVALTGDLGNKVNLSADLLNLTAPAESVDDTQSTHSGHNTAENHRVGLISRSVHRGLVDQKQIYLAPFKPSNFKWDALFGAGAATVFPLDMRIERVVPTTHQDLYHNVAAVTLVGTSVSLASLWAYGIKTHNDHAKETGELELEALANTFLIYTPMQLVAARERPDEGRGGGRFLVQHSFNTSFPAGHPMFTWTMASVIAHEYPKPWVQILAYGTASTLSVSRIMGRNHFSSDVWVGTVLGYFIGSHIFHARCMPGLSKACHRDTSDE